MLWILKDYLSITFHNIDTSCSNLSPFPALAVLWRLQDDRFEADDLYLESGESLFPCPVLLFLKHCKSKRSSLLVAELQLFFLVNKYKKHWFSQKLSCVEVSPNKRLPFEPPVTKAALPVSLNTNFSRRSCIESYQTGISKIHGTHLQIFGCTSHSWTYKRNTGKRISDNCHCLLHNNTINIKTLSGSINLNDELPCLYPRIQEIK